MDKRPQVRTSAVIHVEFYGIPRRRAGAASVVLAFDENPVPLAALIGRLAQQFPQLNGECIAGGQFCRGYIANINGEAFAGGTNAPCQDTPLNDGDRVLLLSADAGG